MALDESVGASNSLQREPISLAARPWPIPAQMIAKSAAGGAAIAFYFGVGVTGLPGGPAFVFVLWILGTLLFALIIVGPPVRRILGIAIALDQGGLRLALHGARSYWPFALLSGARIEKSMFGPDRFVMLDRFGRSVVEVPLLNGSAKASAELVALRLREGVAKGHVGSPPVEQGLSRGQRSMEEWLEGLEALAALPESGDYRIRGLDRASLLELVDHPASSVDLRAGAVYLLLKSGRAEQRQAALDRLSPSSPPLVLAMAERAAAGELPVDRSARKAACAILDPDDQQAVRTASSKKES